MKSLTDQEWEWVLNDAYTTVPIDETIAKVGFKTRREFDKWLKANPEKKMEWEQAQVDACVYLENDLLNLHKDKRLDSKILNIKASNIQKILVARKPEKYGNKLDLNVNQTVSIRHNLEKANERLKEAMRDVTASAALITGALDEKK